MLEEGITYGGKVEYDSEYINEDRDGEIYPLHVLERLGALAHIDKEDVGPENGRNDSANTIESLGEVDAQLRVLWRSTHSNWPPVSRPIFQRLSMYSRYGFAAVSRLPKPFPMTKVAAQKPPNERYTRHGQVSSAPVPNKNRPQMNTVLYPQCLSSQFACPSEARGYAPK